PRSGCSARRHRASRRARAANESGRRPACKRWPRGRSCSKVLHALTKELELAAELIERRALRVELRHRAIGGDEFLLQGGAAAGAAARLRRPPSGGAWEPSRWRTSATRPPALV